MATKGGDGWGLLAAAVLGTAVVVDSADKVKQIANLQIALGGAQDMIDRQRVSAASREEMLRREVQAAGAREAETERRAATDVAAANTRAAQIDASRSEIMRGRDRLQAENETLRRDHVAELAARDKNEADLRKQVEDLTANLAGQLAPSTSGKA